MKYEGDIETFKFVGDSSVNRAKKMVKGKPTETYTQTDIIDALNSKKHLVCGGSKLISKKNDPRIGYIIYYGKEKSNPEYIVRIIIDKEMVEKGDINALAIDSLCQHSIRVNHRNNARIAAAVGVAIVSAGIAVGAFIATVSWALDKEDAQKKSDTDAYLKWLQEQRLENGEYPLGMDAQTFLDETLSNNSKEGRSY